MARRRSHPSPRRSIRLDRRLAHANFLRLRINPFRQDGERLDAEDLIRDIVQEILLPRATALSGGRDVQAGELARNAANDMIGRVRAGSLRFLSAWIEERILFRALQRLLRVSGRDLSDVSFPPDEGDLVMQGWGPDWLRLFLNLLLLSRRCFAYIRAYAARDRHHGWRGRLTALYLGPGRDPTRKRNPILTRDLQQGQELLRDLSDAYESLVTGQALNAEGVPADAVEHLLWQLHFEAFPPSQAEDVPPGTARLVGEVTRRLPCTSPRYPALSEALRQIHELTRRPQPPDLCAALDEFLLDLDGPPFPGDPPGPGSPLLQVLDAVGPSHPNMDPPEKEPLAVWTGIRAARPAADRPSPLPAPGNGPPNEDLFEWLSARQPARGPHAMILGHLWWNGGKRWLDDLYESADVVFHQEGPIALPNRDLVDARQRVREWQAYFQRQQAGTGSPYQALWFLEVPPHGRDRASLDDLARALGVLEAWAAPDAPAPPTAWGGVPKPERDLVRGALISLYLEDLADDMACW